MNYYGESVDITSTPLLTSEEKCSVEVALRTAQGVQEGQGVAEVSQAFAPLRQLILLCDAQGKLSAWTRLLLAICLHLVLGGLQAFFADSVSHINHLWSHKHTFVLLEMHTSHLQTVQHCVQVAQMLFLSATGDKYTR